MITLTLTHAPFNPPSDVRHQHADVALVVGPGGQSFGDIHYYPRTQKSMPRKLCYVLSRGRGYKTLDAAIAAIKKERGL